MRRILGLVVGLVSVLGVGMFAAVATPPKDATRDDIARAVMVTGGPVEVQTGKETTVHKVTIAPGGSSGWHRHYDGGVFMVMSGTMTTYGLDGPACEPTTVPVGEAYFLPARPHHPHLVLNEGVEPLELLLLYFNVPEGEPSRLDAEGPAECPGELR